MIRIFTFLFLLISFSIYPQSTVKLTVGGSFSPKKYKIIKSFDADGNLVQYDSIKFFGFFKGKTIDLLDEVSDSLPKMQILPPDYFDRIDDTFIDELRDLEIEIDVDSIAGHTFFERIDTDNSTDRKYQYGIKISRKKPFSNKMNANFFSSSFYDSLQLNISELLSDKFEDGIEIDSIQNAIAQILDQSKFVWIEEDHDIVNSLEKKLKEQSNKIDSIVRNFNLQIEENLTRFEELLQKLEDVQ